MTTMVGVCGGCDMGGYGGRRRWVEKERHNGERDKERKNKKLVGLWWLIGVGL